MAAGRTHLLALLVAAMASAATAAAQEPPAALTISLVDGVRQSLEHARVLQLARENVTLQEANVRQTHGAFDAVIQAGPLFEHREDAIENTAFFDPERVKRGFANGLRDGFGNVADALHQQIAQGRGDLPLCPPEGTYSAYYVTLPGSTVPVPLCRPAALALHEPSLDSQATGNVDSSFLLRQALPFDPLSSFQLQLLLAQAYPAQIATISLESRERGSELLQTLETAARTVEVKAGLVAIRLGDMPEWVYANTASVFGQYVKPTRRGSLFEFTATFDGRATLFRDKPIDPTFGGTDVPNRFGNRLEAAWVQPLKRGRGADTVLAAERASAKGLEASRFTLQQTFADQALTTADAYFDLIAAQDSVALLSRSLTSQRQLLDSTIRQVGAATVATADIARVRARTSEVEASVQSALASQLRARASLAEAMGLSSIQLTTLAAADAFPVAPVAIDTGALSREAVGRRADVKASTAFLDTSKILLTAAKAETRSRLDVRFSGGFAQAYHSATWHSLFDENGVHVNNDQYARYYSPVGLGRAFQEKWEPIASVTGVFELPLGNRTRLGRLAQANASVRQSEIRLADLGRTIENTLPRIVSELRQLRAEWEQRQEAVVQYESTWDVAQRQRAAGDLTLIDTLLTEQQLTQARLQLVQAKRAYASAVARFRRETGTLVDFSGSSPQGQLNLAGMVAGR